MTFKEPNLMHTFYFFGNLEKKKKYTNCVRIYFSCFKKVCNIQNTQYSGPYKGQSCRRGTQFQQSLPKKTVEENFEI